MTVSIGVVDEKQLVISLFLVDDSVAIERLLLSKSGDCLLSTLIDYYIYNKHLKQLSKNLITRFSSAFSIPNEKYTKQESKKLHSDNDKLNDIHVS